MNSPLIMPRHVAEKQAEEKARQDAAKLDSMVSEGLGETPPNITHHMETDDFLSPTSVKAQLMELQSYVNLRREYNPNYHLMKPLGWRMTVLMLTFPKITEAGLQLVDSTLDARAMTTPQGVVLQQGELCYTDPDRFLNGETMTQWVKPGDRITWKKYDIATFTMANKQILGILTDSQPVGVIDEDWEVPK